MKRIVPFLMILSIATKSCSQNNMYDPKDYIEIKRGVDSFGNGGFYEFAILYLHKKDSEYQMKRYFFDSSYQKIVFENFFKDGKLNGPYKAFDLITGRIAQIGFYDNDLRNGTWESFQDGKLIKRAFYKNDVKIGDWEEYNAEGKLIKKTRYDNQGNIIKESQY